MDMMKNNTGNRSEATKGEESLFERLIFGHRLFFLFFFGLITIVLGFQASKLDWEVNFIRMIPTKHPYIDNYLEHKDELKGFGDSIQIAVETTKGSIFDARYLKVLQEINDEVFFFPGVNRAGLKSLWTPQTRWMAVTEEGFDGGPVMPSYYDGSKESLQALKVNVLRSGEIGSLVANNFKSSIIHVPLHDVDPATKQPLDYYKLSQHLEKLRIKYETNDIKIHISGFAKVIGELIDGSRQVSAFFLIAILVTLIMLYGYSRCIRSTIIPVVCSIVAVVWQLGLLQTLGYGLDPFSTLVPFLIFAIGVSHGVQIINGLHHEAKNGVDKINAAILSFRKLHKPGFIALITDCIGFATLMLIEISAIQDLAISASIGVFTLVLTNLVLLTILMSYAGVKIREPRRPQSQEVHYLHKVWNFLSKFTKRKPAMVAILIALVIFLWGGYTSRDLPIGQTGQGAPELRHNSRYNKDIRFINQNYSDSSELFCVMVKTPERKCDDYHTLVATDRLQWRLEKLPGVLSTASAATDAKRVLAAFNEGYMKWMSLSRDPTALIAAVRNADPINKNQDCSLLALRVFLTNHKADTLQQVVDTVEQFAAKNNTEKVKFLLAAGNSGIDAATNIVVAKKQYTMLIWVYGVVAGLCLLTFRTFRSLFSILIPLALTTVLCRMVMIWIGTGVNVSTLPVIALGVGVGVDYGIYIYSRFQHYLGAGLSTSDAYYWTLETTGKAVIFTGLTLAVGVCTWVFSPIKFQADMGILLTFMFIVNMIGAIILIPAIASLWDRAVRTGNKTKANELQNRLN